MRIRGGRAKYTQAFTIIEVMIVLAVTTGLFMIATVLISGKQARTEFAVASRLMRSQIQTVLNEAASGYYPNENINCWIKGEAYYGATPHFSVSANNKGKNTQCIYAGNMLIFGPSNGTQPHIDNIKYFPMAGNARTWDTDTRNVRDTAISAIAPNISDWSWDFPNLGSTIKLTGGMKYVAAKVNDVYMDSTKPFALFATNLNSQKWFSNDPTQASQNLALRWVPSDFTYASNGDPGLASWIGIEPFVAYYATPQREPFPTFDSAELCFSSGGTNQSMLLSFKYGSTEPSYKILEGKTCGW